MSNSTQSSPSGEMRVSPLMRAMVVAIAFALFQVVTSLLVGGTEPLAARALALGLNAAANFIEGLVSGFGWLVRLLAGLFLVTPIDHAPSVILERPGALSAPSIVEQAVVATASTLLLPWLDPPAVFWRWMQSASGVGRQLRFVIILVAWSAWLIAAALVYLFLGSLVGEIMAVSLGQSSEPWSGFERAALWVLALLVVIMIATIAFALTNRRGERSARLMQGLGLSVIFAAAFALQHTLTVACIAYGFLDPGPTARKLLADQLTSFMQTPIWFATEMVGLSIGFALFLSPLVFGLLALDAGAARSGRRSIVTTIALVLAVAALVATALLLVAVLTGGLLYGSSDRIGPSFVTRVVALVLGFAAAAWIVRQRTAVARPQAEWPDIKPVYTPLPDAVADAVADNAERQG